MTFRHIGMKQKLTINNMELHHNYFYKSNVDFFTSILLGRITLLLADFMEFNEFDDPDVDIFPLEAASSASSVINLLPAFGVT